MLEQMQETNQQFSDGMRLEILSPSERTLVVTQNNSPLAPDFVTSSSGPFVALTPYSYVIKMNEQAQDLIAIVDIPFQRTTLEQQGIEPGNTFVGTLAPDGKSWVIDDGKRNVNLYVCARYWYFLY